MANTISLELPADFNEAIRKLMFTTAVEAYKKAGESKTLPEYMKLGEACEYLSVSRVTLDKLIKTHGLKATMIDGITRVRKQDIIEFMEAHSI
jgi:DNA binding domain, excisionase family